MNAQTQAVRSTYSLTGNTLLDAFDLLSNEFLPLARSCPDCGASMNWRVERGIDVFECPRCGKKEYYK